MYTKEQVERMLSGCIDQTMNFAENGGIMTEEEAKEIISDSMSSLSINKNDGRVQAILVDMEYIRKEEFPDNSVCYYRHKNTGQIIVYSKGEYADRLIQLVESL